MSRHDAFSKFQQRTAHRPPASTRPRLDLPERGARSFVEMERERRSRSEAVARRREAPRRRAPERRAGSRFAEGRAQRAREVAGWSAAAVAVALLAVGWLLVVPLPSRAGSDAAAVRRAPAPEAVTPESPGRSAEAVAGPPRDDPGAWGRAVPGPASTTLPRQISAPDVVALMVGGLAERWTYESIDGETTLRVDVPEGDMPQALRRASRALRSSTGRRALRQLGADHLELRSPEGALSLRVASGQRP